MIGPQEVELGVWMFQPLCGQDRHGTGSQWVDRCCTNQRIHDLAGRDGRSEREQVDVLAARRLRDHPAEGHGLLVLVMRPDMGLGLSRVPSGGEAGPEPTLQSVTYLLMIRFCCSRRYWHDTHVVAPKARRFSGMGSSQSTQCPSKSGG